MPFGERLVYPNVRCRWSHENRRFLKGLWFGKKRSFQISKNYQKKLKQTENGGYGLVTGSRNQEEKDVGVKRKWHRKFLGFASNLFFKVLAGIKLKVNPQIELLITKLSLINRILSADSNYLHTKHAKKFSKCNIWKGGLLILNCFWFVTNTKSPTKKFRLIGMMLMVIWLYLIIFTIFIIKRLALKCRWGILLNG